jgi:hypothetical protein
MNNPSRANITLKAIVKAILVGAIVPSWVIIKVNRLTSIDTVGIVDPIEGRA